MSTLQIKQQGGNTCFKETAPESKSAIYCFHFCPWESPLYCPLPLKHGHHCRVYMWTLPQCDGSPWDQGNSLRMQWLCCFVDIMVEFTWGNVRENHNMLLLLRTGGQGTETGSDLIWGFYKPYCGTKKTEQYSTSLTHTTKYNNDECSWKKIKNATPKHVFWRWLRLMFW